MANKVDRLFSYIPGMLVLESPRTSARVHEYYLLIVVPTCECVRVPCSLWGYIRRKQVSTHCTTSNRRITCTYSCWYICTIDIISYQQTSRVIPLPSPVVKQLCASTSTAARMYGKNISIADVRGTAPYHGCESRVTCDVYRDREVKPSGK